MALPFAGVGSQSREENRAAWTARVADVALAVAEPSAGADARHPRGMPNKESLSPTASSPPSEDVAMDDVDAALSSGNSGDEAASQNPQAEEGGGGGGGGGGKEGGSTTNLAKFKASQDLRIQTANLPPPASAGKPKPRANSVGSAARAEGDGSGGAEDKTPGPAPCSTGKKRRRRTAAQIDRKYPCTYPGCTKAYGSEGSLTQHQRLKHRNQSPEPGVQASQLSGFFLPLHRTPRSLPGNISRPNGPGSARNVNIRPAGIDGLTLHSFDVAAAAAALVPENDTISGDFLLSSPSDALGNARHLRARSNSMPISFSTPGALSLQYATPPPSAIPSGESTPSAKPKSARRARASGTPRSGKPPLRRNKCRSKSESLNELVEPFVFQDEIRPPHHERSTSDSAGFGMHNDPPYDWRFAIAQSNSDSPASSVEDAIDSDILSVLADYDTSDAGDSTLEMVRSGSFDDTAETPRGMTGQEPESEWLSHQDALYLTTHLEKMSMIHDSPPGSISSQVIPENDPMGTIKLDELPLSIDTSPMDHTVFKEEFPAVSIESFTVTEHHAGERCVAGEDIKDGLKFHVSGVFDSNDSFTPAVATALKQDPATAPAWSKELAALETYSSSGIDQADFMDIDSSAYGPLQWKTEKRPAPQSTFGTAYDSLSSYLQHGEKHGLYPTIGDSFTLDTADYAMEEQRLSSPVVCQQEDL